MERDGCCQSTHSYNADFNSHAHVERDVNPAERVKIYFNFNSHAHVERDVSYNRKQYLNKDFNSHAHVERDILNEIANEMIGEFQLTRSRGA